MNLDDLIAFLSAGRDLKHTEGAKVSIMIDGVPCPLENVTMNADGSMNIWPEED